MTRWIAAAALACLPALAHAQTFTFTSASQPAQPVATLTLPDGQPNGAIVATETRLTFAGDKTTEAAGTCSNWILPPGASVASEGVCKLRDAAGQTYTLAFSCDAAPGAGCQGKLFGRGRSGDVSYRAAADASGVGVWTAAAEVVRTAAR